MIKITDEIYVDPDQVVSVEREKVHSYRSYSLSDTTTYCSFDGTRITLKNGRKVFVENIMPDKIMEVLNAKTK